MTFYCYPGCSTCRAAAKWLTDHGFEFQSVDIKQTPPSTEVLTEVIKQSGLPLKRFFNTSGNSYRNLDLASRFDDLSEGELIELLSQDGMLIKRPIVVAGETVVVGFKPADWEQQLLGQSK